MEKWRIWNIKLGLILLTFLMANLLEEKKMQFPFSHAQSLETIK
jgi:hypothetical protein